MASRNGRAKETPAALRTVRRERCFFVINISALCSVRVPCAGIITPLTNHSESKFSVQAADGSCYLQARTGLPCIICHGGRAITFTRGLPSALRHRLAQMFIAG